VSEAEFAADPQSSAVPATATEDRSTRARGPALALTTIATVAGLFALWWLVAAAQIVPPLFLPSPLAVLGKLDLPNNSSSPTLRDEVAKSGARTIPPRENGGNCDIKNLSKGSIVFLPVYISGAGLAVGDIHFAQGDGEITFCGAIEMAGWVEMKVEVLKNGVERLAMKNPIFRPGPVEPRFSDFVVFQGISVDDHGKQVVSPTDIT